jgi:hypothetical protein
LAKPGTDVQTQLFLLGHTQMAIAVPAYLKISGDSMPSIE